MNKNTCIYIDLNSVDIKSRLSEIIIDSILKKPYELTSCEHLWAAYRAQFGVNE